MREIIKLKIGDHDTEDHFKAIEIIDQNEVCIFEQHIWETGDCIEFSRTEAARAGKILIHFARTRELPDIEEGDNQDTNTVIVAQNDKIAVVQFRDGRYLIVGKLLPYEFGYPHKSLVFDNPNAVIKELVALLVRSGW